MMVKAYKKGGRKMKQSMYSTFDKQILWVNRIIVIFWY